MPELPEVETMRRGVLGAVGGRITDVRRLRCHLKPIPIQPAMATFRRRSRGRTISAVERLGKRILFRLDNDDRILMEPRMTGLVLASSPPDREHLRFRLQLKGGELSSVSFWDRRGLGQIRLLSASDYQQQLGPHKVGPDALEVTAAELRSRFQGSRRAIKPALLDQKALAGIGNLYASEILHQAKVHPAARCHRMSWEQWRRIHRATRAVLRLAIRYEGSTLSDGTYRNALNNPGRYQNHHCVYDRSGQLCGACGAAQIRRIVQAQRSTFFCPACQKRTA